jgi:hypothetical protein
MRLFVERTFFSYYLCHGRSSLASSGIIPGIYRDYPKEQPSEFTRTHICKEDHEDFNTRSLCHTGLGIV